MVNCGMAGWDLMAEFDRMARGLGCALGSPVQCLAPLLSPPAWLAGVKTTAGFYISFKRLFVSYLSLFEIRAEEKEQMR